MQGLNYIPQNPFPKAPMLCLGDRRVCPFSRPRWNTRSLQSRSFLKACPSLPLPRRPAPPASAGLHSLGPATLPSSTGSQPLSLISRKGRQTKGRVGCGWPCAPPLPPEWTCHFLLCVGVSSRPVCELQSHSLAGLATTCQGSCYS